MDSDKSLLSILWKARRSRFSMVGANHYAAVAGTVLLPGAGIGLGFYLGSLLDGHFGTRLWAPLLAVLGLVAGFRELFNSLRTLSRQSSNTVKPTPRIAGSRTVLPRTGREHLVETKIERGRRSSFVIPPPPVPGSEIGADTPDTPESAEVPDMGLDAMRRMLKEDRDRSADTDKSQ